MRGIDGVVASADIVRGIERDQSGMAITATA